MPRKRILRWSSIEGGTSPYPQVHLFDTKDKYAGTLKFFGYRDWKRFVMTMSGHFNAVDRLRKEKRASNRRREQRRPKAE